MGNGYNQHLHHHNVHIHHKSTFLPMLCSRPSIKDVALPKWEDRSMSVSRDPLSPKIGCMGQVKRNNKIVGLPSSNKFAITIKNNDATIKYSKLKRIFSARNLLTNTAASATNSCSRRRRGVILNSGGESRIDDSRENSVSVRIEDMDPPLPVIKKEPKPANGEDSLWKRRARGVALQNLQLQDIQLNKNHLVPSTV